MSNPMLNDEQNDYVEYLGNLPKEKRCPCGWYHIKDCQEGRGCPACSTEEGRQREYSRHE